jgi:hypothetical protein
MELSVNVLSWLGRPKKAVKAQTIKFNRFNLIFHSRCKLKPGQMIFINISEGLHSLREVSARVESCERSGSNYQTQVRFVLERPDKQPYREAIAILKAIEQNVPTSVLAPLHMQAQ